VKNAQGPTLLPAKGCASNLKYPVSAGAALVDPMGSRSAPARRILEAVAASLAFAVVALAAPSSAEVVYGPDRRDEHYPGDPWGPPMAESVMVAFPMPAFESMYGGAEPTSPWLTPCTSVTQLPAEPPSSRRFGKPRIPILIELRFREDMPHLLEGDPFADMAFLAFADDLGMGKARFTGSASHRLTSPPPGLTCSGDAAFAGPGANMAPWPVASNEILDECRGVVRFDAISSTDADGMVSYFQWDFGDGTRSDAATVEHTYTDPGIYKVGLIVRDDAGAVSQAAGHVRIPRCEDGVPVVDDFMPPMPEFPGRPPSRGDMSSMPKPPVGMPPMPWAPWMEDEGARGPSYPGPYGPEPGPGGYGPGAGGDGGYGGYGGW
jgi:hypothetical protein